MPCLCACVRAVVCHWFLVCVRACVRAFVRVRACVLEVMRKMLNAVLHCVYVISRVHFVSRLCTYFVDFIVLVLCASGSR